MSARKRESARLTPELVERTLRERADSLAVEQAQAVVESREDVLLFTLGEEYYGVRIAQVREIYNEYVITPVPCVPPHIVGVINIRGEIVSVTDLAMLMGVGGGAEPVGPDGEQLPVIVVADAAVCTALMVDSIGDIVEIAAASVEPSVAMADKLQSDYVSGAVYSEGRVVALIGVSKILAPVGGA